MICFEKFPDWGAKLFPRNHGLWGFRGYRGPNSAKGSPLELLHSPRHHLRQACEGVRGLQFQFFCTDMLPAGDKIAFTSFHFINSQGSYFFRWHAHIEKCAQSIFGEHAQSMRFMKMKKCEKRASRNIGQRFRCKVSNFRPGHSGYQIRAERGARARGLWRLVKLTKDLS